MRARSPFCRIKTNLHSFEQSNVKFAISAKKGIKGIFAKYSDVITTFNGLNHSFLTTTSTVYSLIEDFYEYKTVLHRRLKKAQKLNIRQAYIKECTVHVLSLN